MIPRLRQPLPWEVTRILSGHPLARNLVTALCFNHTGMQIVNAVTGQVAGTVTDPIVSSERRCSLTGVSLGSPGFSSASAIPGVTLSGPGWSANSDATLVVSLRFFASDSYGTVCTQGATIGLWARSTGAWTMYPASDSTATLVVGAWTTLAITRSAAGVTKYFVNGIFLEQAAVGAGTTAFAFNSIFNDVGSDTFYDGDIEYIHIWDGRVLSAGEIWDQFVNPYAIYQPSLLTNTLYHYPAAAGGSIRRPIFNVTQAVNRASTY